jgi:hypothetical protein
MTPFLDKLRSKRKSDWVFVNSHGEPYTTSTSPSCHFFSSCRFVCGVCFACSHAVDPSCHC